MTNHALHCLKTARVWGKNIQKKRRCYLHYLVCLLYLCSFPPETWSRVLISSVLPCEEQFFHICLAQSRTSGWSTSGDQWVDQIRQLWTSILDDAAKNNHFEYIIIMNIKNNTKSGLSLMDAFFFNSQNIYGILKCHRNSIWRNIFHTEQVSQFSFSHCMQEARPINFYTNN